MDNPFRLTVYNKAFKRLGWIGAPRRVDVVPRHNQVGYGKVTIAADDPRVPHLVEPGARMTFDYLGEQVMSGRVASLTGTGPRAASEVEVVVEDDFRLLTRLLGWPNPAGTLDQQGAATAYDTITGAAETVIKTLVTRNKGRSAPGVTVVADAGRGATITASLRMHPIADRVLPLVDQAGIGVDIRQQGTGLVLDCYLPRQVPQVLSEESGVVVGWQWTTTAPSATRVVVGGQGEGTAREFVQVVDPDRENLWGETIEVFRDARDTDEPDVLTQRGQETLAEGAATTGLSLTLAESRGWAYGRSVRVGDRVTTRIAPGAAITDILREAQIVWDVDQGLTVTPVVGERSDDPSVTLRGTINTLARAIRDLKAR